MHTPTHTYNLCMKDTCIRILKLRGEKKQTKKKKRILMHKYELQMSGCHDTWMAERIIAPTRLSVLWSLFFFLRR